MEHNFDASLKYERSMARKADDFYLSKLAATRIVRYDSATSSDMRMQLQDVDLSLTLNEITYKISEKFRDKEYGDLYVEVYSKYPTTQGWLFTGSPNAILYFTPHFVYWITHKSLAAFCIDILFPAIPVLWFLELYNSKTSIITKRVKIENKFVKINLIKAYNSMSDGAKWVTIGISASFLFFEQNGVKIKKWNL